MTLTEFGVLCNVRNDDIKDGTFIFPEGVKSIGLWAFQECTDLKHIAIPEGIEVIDDFAFDHCTSLEHIELPKSLKEIGNFSFLYCTSLKEITIPDGTITIGLNAFECCSKLHKVDIPDSVKTIGTRAFYECKSLEDLSIPKSANVQKEAFLNCPARVEYRQIVHPKLLDCAIDKRFNGDFATLRINGEEKTINEWYYISRRKFDGDYVDKNKVFDHLIDPFTGVKLPPNDANDLYRGLWITYLKHNPDLVEYAFQFHDIVDTDNRYSEMRRKQIDAYNADPFNKENEFRYKNPEILRGAEIIGAYVLGNRDFYVKSVQSSHWYKTMVQYKKLPIAEKILNFLEKEDPCFWYSQGLPKPRSREDWLKTIEQDLAKHHYGWYVAKIRELGDSSSSILTNAKAIIHELQKQKISSIDERIAKAEAKRETQNKPWTERLLEESIR